MVGRKQGVVGAVGVVEGMQVMQVMDDILDYVASPEELGKPGAGADLGAGLRTAPLLLAARWAGAGAGAGLPSQEQHLPG